MPEPLWEPGSDLDKRLRELGDDVGETNLLYDETGPQLRVLFCAYCKTIDEIPDYVGRDENDVLLQDVLERHARAHSHALEGKVFLRGRIAQKAWSDRSARRKIIENVWSILGVKQSNLGLGDEFYASRSTFTEDAVKCHIRHSRSIPCLDWMNDSKRIGNPTKQGWREGQVRVYLCHFCPVASHVMEAKHKAEGMFDK
jgi:hypothetical protein